MDSPEAENMTAPDFKKILSQLDGAGYVCEIKKVGNRQYNLIINFEVTDLRKTRITLKRKIIRLYNAVFGTVLCEICFVKDKLLVFEPAIDNYLCEECIANEQCAA